MRRHAMQVVVQQLIGHMDSVYKTFTRTALHRQRLASFDKQ